MSVEAPKPSEGGEKQKKLMNRRQFLEGITAVAGLTLADSLLPRSNAAEKVPPKPEKEQTSKWVSIGPFVEARGEKDGIRAANASKDGSTLIASTWDNGTYLGRYQKNGGVEWLHKFGKEASVSVTRHILILEPQREVFSQSQGNVRAIIICDWGLQILRQEESGYKLETTPFPGTLLDRDFSFAQTGCLLPNGDLLLGGKGGIFKIRNWEGKSSDWKVEGLLNKSGGFNNKQIIIRTIAVDPNNPEIIYAGGWWGYSGQDKDSQGCLLPGAGVWKSKQGGRPESWRNVMLDANVNCLFVNPKNANVIVVGKEGSGDEADRKPHKNDPKKESLSISLNGGEDFVSFNPPGNLWDYDLITPQQAFYYDNGNDDLYISCWGGPVWQVHLPPDISQKSLAGLNWSSLMGSVPKSEYQGGHLIGIRRGSIVDLITGSKKYWVRPISATPQFNPLHRLTVQTNTGAELL